jgi:hypothetical protein
VSNHSTKLPQAKASIISVDNPFVFFLASTKALFETSSSIVFILEYNCFQSLYCCDAVDHLFIQAFNTSSIDSSTASDNHLFRFATTIFLLVSVAIAHGFLK